MFETRKTQGTCSFYSHLSPAVLSHSWKVFGTESSEVAKSFILSAAWHAAQQHADLD